MGPRLIEAVVRRRADKSAAIESLVDCGTFDACVPAGHWKALGLKSNRGLRFTPADGTKIGRGIPECRVDLPLKDRHASVIPGEPRDAPLLREETPKPSAGHAAMKPAPQHWRQQNDRAD
jgi:hypothetical protein